MHYSSQIRYTVDVDVWCYCLCVKILGSIKPEGSKKFWRMRILPLISTKLTQGYITSQKSIGFCIHKEQFWVNISQANSLPSSSTSYWYESHGLSSISGSSFSNSFLILKTEKVCLWNRSFPDTASYCCYYIDFLKKAYPACSRIRHLPKNPDDQR